MGKVYNSFRRQIGMYDIGISEIAVTAKYEDTEDKEDILKKPLPFSDIFRINI